MMRLDRFVAENSALSRSRASEAIRRGEVSVNGKPAGRPDDKINETTDKVLLRGELLNASGHRSIMLHKPAGYVTAARDSRDKTVMELFPEELRRGGLQPAGRLDKDTTGLLILTTDGDLAHRIISPRSGIIKCYEAEVEGKLEEEDVAAFRSGLVLRDGTRCLPAELEILAPNRGRVRISEGKYHQVKRMFASLRLHRVSVGGLRLDADLAPGAWRELSEEDLCILFKD